MHAALSEDYDRLLVPREVATEIGDKSGEVQKFKRADPLFKGLVRDSMIEILESDAENDEALVRAIKLVSRLPPSELLTRRRKDLGEAMVVAHAIKLRDDWHHPHLGPRRGLWACRSRGYEKYIRAVAPQ